MWIKSKLREIKVNISTCQMQSDVYKENMDLV